MKLRKAYYAYSQSGEFQGWGWCPKWARECKAAGLRIVTGKVLTSARTCNGVGCNH